MRQPIQRIPNYERVKNYAEYWDFVDWIATPTPLRNPSTQKEWAKQHSMHENQCGRWKAMTEFRRDIDQRVGEKMAVDHTADVSYSLINRIFKEGRAAEVRLFREWAHEWMPQLRIKLEGPTDEKSASLLKQLAEEFDHKVRDALAKKKDV